MASSTRPALVLAAAAIGAGCASGGNDSPGGDAAVVVDAGPDAGTDAGTDAGAQPTCVAPTTPGSCAAPVGTALPICKLSLTGCMDPQDITRFSSRAVYYEINSPLWSDNAAKARAFVLPAGGTIHVKSCQPGADPASLAECVSPTGLPSGPADTGRWVFPVGTVMIKNFLFDGKRVETRLLMRVDAATAAIIQNGTDWVGYNYAWNEAQTEATVVPNARTQVRFNTGAQTVTWSYPSFFDCISCHNRTVGTLGPETAQMNRTVNGNNQIDAFASLGLFDSTAPARPYAEPLVEPYANAALGLQGPGPGATVEQAARSYLSANCGFCHRPDVNDQGFDLRHLLSLSETRICNLMQQNGIPGMTDQMLVDLKPGDHTASAAWLRMNIPASDPGGRADVGRMPPVASAVVDPQATALIGSWIDSLSSCPTQ
jgi:cytochrome c551/c552